jgi:ribonuclease Z
VTPALAYRFDFKDRSIVFSGDTAPSEAVDRIAKGAGRPVLQRRT